MPIVLPIALPFVLPIASPIVLPIALPIADCLLHCLLPCIAWCRLVPIVFFETSLQAQFVIPMAVSLAFGVLFATVVTLLLIPSLYLIVEDIKQVFSRRKRATTKVEANKEKASAVS